MEILFIIGLALFFFLSYDLGYKDAKKEMQDCKDDIIDT